MSPAEKEATVFEHVSSVTGGISPRELEEQCRQGDPSGRQTREAVQTLLRDGRVRIDDDYKIVAKSG